MKKFLLCISLVVLVISLQITTFATDGTPVEITLGDVYDVTSFSLTLEDTAGEITKLSFAKKDEFKTTVVLPAGEYKISDCKYVSPDNTNYSVELNGTTFSIPKSTNLIKIKLITGQKPKNNTFLDFLNKSKVPLVVLCVCGIIYFYLQRKQTKNIKIINPELKRMMDEHEAMQEFYQSDKIDYSQYAPENKSATSNESEYISFENEFTDTSEE